MVRVHWKFESSGIAHRLAKGKCVGKERKETNDDS